MSVLAVLLIVEYFAGTSTNVSSGTGTSSNTNITLGLKLDETRSVSTVYVDETYNTVTNEAEEVETAEETETTDGVVSDLIDGETEETHYYAPVDSDANQAEEFDESTSYLEGNTYYTSE